MSNDTPPAAAAPERREEIMRFFAFEHLPARLQGVSRPFADLAEFVHKLPRCAERAVALRKLLESKDAAVRAALPPVPRAE